MSSEEALREEISTQMRAMGTMDIMPAPQCPVPPGMKQIGCASNEAKKLFTLGVNSASNQAMTKVELAFRREIIGKMYLEELAGLFEQYVGLGKFVLGPTWTIFHDPSDSGTDAARRHMESIVGDNGLFAASASLS